VVHRDATVAPLGGPVCEVVTVAKRDLKAGETLDGIGGFCNYGLIENTATARQTDALPIGLSEGCVLLRDIPKDSVVSFNDVRQPKRDPLIDARWQEQCARWPHSAQPTQEPTGKRPSPASQGTRVDVGSRTAL
jgi:predicted homoserine dehydrogenase-like protein